MSEPENFLTRWSRRKAEADREAEAAPEPARLESGTLESAADVPTEVVKTDDKEESAFDVSKLPSIESIGRGTDVSAFLQKGVPADIARAALRRVWTSDPAIRDFIGIAENQYDFATGSDIPGFGPLGPADDVAKMVAQIMREGVLRPSAPRAENERAENKEPSKVEQEKEEATLSKPTEVESTAAADGVQPVVVASAEPSASIDAAPQQKEEDDAPAAVPSHGRALPR
jgi:hypothetical protein